MTTTSILRALPGADATQARSALVGVARLGHAERSPLMVLLDRVAQRLPRVDVRLASIDALPAQLAATAGLPTVVVPLTLTPQRRLLQHVQEATLASRREVVTAGVLGADGTIATALGRRLREQGLDRREDVLVVVAPFGWENETEVALAWAALTIAAETPARVVTCRADRLEETVRAHRAQATGHVAVLPWEVVASAFTAGLRRAMDPLGVCVLDPVGPHPSVVERVVALSGVAAWELLGRSA